MEEKGKRGISRRDFLVGAGVTAGAAALGAGLAGCSSSGSSSSSSSSSSSGSADTAKHTWEVAPDPITDISETKDYDIVIVGAGIAGNSAAEAAARNGASVVVLERTDSIQGRGVDVAAPGSSWKKRNGIDINIEEAIKLEYLWSQQTVNYQLLKTWGEQNGPVFDYIEEMVGKQGIYMVNALSGTAKYGWDTLPERWRIYPDAVSFVKGDEIGDTRPDGKSCNWNLIEALNKSATDFGAEYVFNTHAEQLVGDAASGITGVIASDADGNYIQYNASKGVILATGDICGNQEMIDVFAPIANRADANIYTPAHCNTGDGILMGCWAGAAISKSPAAPMVHQFTLDSISLNLTSFIMSWLAVNEDGRRYGAEMPFEPYLTDARMNTPHNKAWSIFDSDYAMYVQKQWPTKYETWLDGIEDQMQQHLDAGDLIKADTLEELADKIGVPADNFVESCNSYSQMCVNGVDTQFDVPAQFLSEIKTPPFYATPLVCSVLTIPFGLHVNNDSQVCTSEDEPIKGLFAVGNVQGDFFGLNYPVHCPGISHSRCVVFGQLVGESLAKDTVLTDLTASM